MKRFAAIYLVFSISMLGMAQTLPAPAEPTTVSAPPSKNALVDGTPIRLTLSENISSANAIVGQDVPFTVVDDVVVNGYVVISHGAPAKGTVTEAQPKRRMGRGGKLNINIDSVRLNDNEKVALRAVKDAKGGGHTGAMTTGIVLTADYGNRADSLGFLARCSAVPFYAREGYYDSQRNGNYDVCKRDSKPRSSKVCCASSRKSS